MKRGAERQIQREDGDDPHDVEGDSDGATSLDTEPQSIASRPIRGLPKKKVCSTTSSPAQTISSSPFSFSSFNTTQTSGSTTAPTFTSTGTPSFSTFSSTPSTSTASSSSSSAFASQSAPFSFSAPATNGNGTTGRAGNEVDHYLNLRGLNVSLKSQLSEAIAREIEKDPFVDLKDVLKGVEEQYSTLRKDLNRKRDNATKIASAPSTKSNTAPIAEGGTSAAITMPKAAAAIKSTLSPAASSFTPPKAPTGGGFTFAGSSFSAPSTSMNATATKDLLPGQPTFSIPSTGFYSSFGKTDGDSEKVEDGDDDDDADARQKTSATIAGNAAPTGSKEAISSIPTTSTMVGQSPSFATTANPFASTSSTTPKPFSFSTPSSSAPFSFGSAAPRPNASISNEASPDNKAFRFSFGTNNASQNKTIDEGEKSTDTAFSSTSSSTTSSSPSKAPSIGSNFANTSGVKQGGAFTFGSSKINFGTPSASSNFGSSTGFTFGSSPTKETDTKDGGK